MKISNDGLALIAQFEGCILTAYQDAVGVWTIGYGHTKGVKRGQTITKAQAMDFLRQDVTTAEAHVMAYDFKYHWNQNQFDALVSFTFNIGNIKTLTASGTRTIAQIASIMPTYNKAGGKVLSGLTKRRNSEKELFLKPVSKNTESTTDTQQSSAEIKSSSLKSLQEALNADKIRDDKGNALVVDGVMGPKTQWAINNCLFQSGSKGITVQWIQMHLNTIAGDIFLADKIGALKVSGFFDNQTVKATIAYQKSRSLVADGKIGPKTLTQMIYE